MLEDFALTDVLELPEVESKEPAPRNHYRQFASPGAFRSVLIQTCGREGVRVVKVAGAYTTQQCHVCGDACQWDAAAQLEHVCSNGHKWDQDRNAAINLLGIWQRGIEVSGASA